MNNSPNPSWRTRLHNSAQTDGWHSRGYLPHYDAENIRQFITFRLADSMPAEQIDAWKQELHWRQDLSADSPEAMELHRRVEKYEDAGHGACHLKDERIARLVQDALLYFHEKRYLLLAWCIMPNHVHVLIKASGRDARVPAGEQIIKSGRNACEPKAEPDINNGQDASDMGVEQIIKSGRDARVPGRVPSATLDAIVHSWKSFTSHQANKILQRQGPFWMNEYFDRFIRNEQHFHDTVSYIHNNPVNAGLAPKAEDWPWSSGHHNFIIHTAQETNQ